MSKSNPFPREKAKGDGTFYNNDGPLAGQEIEIMRMVDSQKDADLFQLRDLLAWVGERIQTRTQLGKPTRERCVLCTSGVLNRKGRCRHSEIWELSGTLPVLRQEAVHELQRVEIDARDLAKLTEHYAPALAAQVAEEAKQHDPDAVFMVGDKLYFLSGVE